MSSNEYLPDATKFSNDVKEKPDFAEFMCPVCKGHGGWILKENAYGQGEHFEAFCSQCNGWGWVTKEDHDCIHGWDNGVTIGRCYHEYTCLKCGQKKRVDSSD